MRHGWAPDPARAARRPGRGRFRGLSARLSAAQRHAAPSRGRNGPVTRWKITVEYDGAGFVGWQRQAVGLSVQLALEDAIERLCGRRVTVRSEEHTSEIQSLMSISYGVFCLKKKKKG